MILEKRRLVSHEVHEIFKGREDYAFNFEGA